MIGKRTQQGVYVHSSAWTELPAAIRRKVEVAHRAAKSSARCAFDDTMAKILREGDEVSILCYADFIRDPHPPVVRSVVVEKGRVRRVLDFSQQENPSILHRKEEFVAPDHPLHAKFAAVTRREEKCGLYRKDMLSRIGRKKAWEEWVRRKGCR